MARERLGDLKRSVQIGIKVTPEFRQMIESQADKEGLTLSTFVCNVLKLYFMTASDL